MLRILVEMELFTSGHGICRAGLGPDPVHRFGPPRRPPPLVSGPEPF